MAWNSERSPCSDFGGKNSNENELPPCARSSFMVGVRALNDGRPSDMPSGYRYGVRQSVREFGCSCSRVGSAGDGPDDDDAARPGVEHLIKIAQIDTTDSEPRAVTAQRARVSHEVQPWCRSARLGRRRPARADAEIVDAFLDCSGGNLVLGMCRTPDQHVVGDDRTGNRYRQVVLPKMQNVRAHCPRDISPVVHREQRAVTLTGGRKNLQRSKFLFCFDALLPQLHDVDAACEHGIEKLRKITLLLARVDTQIQACVRKRAPAHAASPPCRGSRPVLALVSRATRRR